MEAWLEAPDLMEAGNMLPKQKINAIAQSIVFFLDDIENCKMLMTSLSNWQADKEAEYAVNWPQFT